MLKSKERSGFTLIELLVVIAIIGILAGILIPIIGVARSAALKTQCAANLKQFGLGINMYANDNSGNFPRRNDITTTTAAQELNSLGLLYDAYVADKILFKCPSDSAVSNEDILLLSGSSTCTSSTCSYGYDDNHDIYDDGGVAIMADALGTVTSGKVLSDNHRNTAGQNVLYIDGHVSFHGTTTCGYYDANNGAYGFYDFIWTDYQNTIATSNDARTSSSIGTDTSILQ